MNLNPLNNELFDRARAGLGNNITNLLQRRGSAQGGSNAASGGDVGGSVGGAAGGADGNSAAAAASEAGGGPSLGSRNPEEIPREELLHLCMKLSKRLKVVEGRSAQLAMVYKQVVAERSELLAFAREVTGGDFSGGRSDDGGGKGDRSRSRSSSEAAAPDGSSGLPLTPKGAAAAAAAAAAGGGSGKPGPPEAAGNAAGALPVGSAASGAAAAVAVDVAGMRAAWLKHDAGRNELIHEVQHSYQEAVRARDADLHRAESTHRREMMELQARLDAAERQFQEAAAAAAMAVAAASASAATPTTSGAAGGSAAVSGGITIDADAPSAATPPPVVPPSPTAAGAASALAAGAAAATSGTAHMLQGEIAKLEREVTALREGGARLQRELDLERQNNGLAMKLNSGLRRQLEALKVEAEQTGTRAERLAEELAETKRQRGEAEERAVFATLQLQNSRKAEGQATHAAAESGRELEGLRVRHASEVEARQAMEQRWQKAVNDRADLEQAAQAARHLKAELESQREAVAAANKERDEAVGAAAAAEAAAASAAAIAARRASQSEAAAAAAARRAAALDERLKGAEKHKAEAEEARQALGEKEAFVARLRAESQTAEQAHATRTALYGKLQEDLEKAHAAIADRERRLAAAQQAAAQNQAKAACLEERAAAAEAAVEAERAAATEAAARRAAEFEASVAELERRQEERLQGIQRENTKRSTLARQLIDDKDKRVRELTLQVEALEAEVASGGHSERKIMELAAAQAQRGGGLAQELERCEAEVAGLREDLAAAAAEAAAARASEARMRRHVDDMSRAERRGDVNLEYLKNVVVQYMTFGAGTSERRALVPVIATLLQFGDEDRQRVQAGLSWEWWGGMMSVKTVTPSLVRS